MGCDVLLLTTIGRRSGTARTTPVGGFSDKDGTWLIVAAAGGTATNPAWYHNIAAHPDDVQIEVEGRKVTVTAEQLHGAERARAWQQITATSPQFTRFRQHTDRQLPLIRLTPRSGSEVVGATESPRSEGAVMNITTRIRTDLGTRWRMHSFERFLEHHTDSLTRRFGPPEATMMRREMLAEYRALIPQVPYIGGHRNPWNSNLAATPMGLAVYRVVLRHGGSAQDAGEMVLTYAQRMIERIPRRLRPRMLGPRRSAAEKEARWSQQRRYPDDWVTEVVDGTGPPFDFGMDVTECAIVKFMRAQGAEEFTPYLCHLDYVLSDAAGVGLTRTKTLAWGFDRCDFRFTNPGTTTATWPPEFPERTCGQPAAPATPAAVPRS